MKKNKRLLNLVRFSVRASFENDKINEEKVKVFLKAFKSLPRHQAIFTTSEYLKGVKRELSQKTLEVQTALDLTKPELEGIRKTMKSKYTIYNVRSIKNPSLLGGIKVKIGDNVFDGSLKEKINEVKEAIINR